MLRSLSPQEFVARQQPCASHVGRALHVGWGESQISFSPRNSRTRQAQLEQAIFEAIEDPNAEKVRGWLAEL